MFLKKFDEFIKINEKKDNDKPFLIPMKKPWYSGKWVCLIVTEKTFMEFRRNHPGQPFNILLGSHKIILGSKDQVERVKGKYKPGNLFKVKGGDEEMITQVVFDRYNPSFYGVEVIKNNKI